jgi:hypothetical protein
MNQQILLDFIKREQAEELPKAKDFEELSADQNGGRCRYTGEYYHGYHNGYLTALMNLQILLANNKDG